MTQRSTPWTRSVIGLGLLALSAAIALPKLTPRPRLPRPVRALRPMVSAETTWFGQACALGEGQASEDTRPVFWLDEQGPGLLPVSAWRYTERSDGSGRVNCLLAERGAPERRWSFEAELFGKDEGRGALDSSGGHEALAEEHYAEHGGEVDTSRWVTWRELKGSLRGVGELEGAYLVLRQDRGPGLQVGYGADNADLHFGFEGRFAFEVASVGTADLPDRPGRGGFRARLTDTDVSLACGAGGGDVLSLPGIGAELVFVAGGRFEEFTDGTARLSGLCARRGEREATFALELALAGARVPGESAYPPLGSPAHELPSTSYAVYDGPVDSTEWHFYESLSGSLVGLGRLEGARIDLEAAGPALQVGLGANGTTLEYGASVTLEATTTRQPEGEARLAETSRGALRLDLGRSSTQFATAAIAEGRKRSEGALDLGALGRDFELESGGQLVEQPDGSARFTASLARRGRPTVRVFVDLAFSGRVGARATGGALGFEARRTMKAERYVEHGGPVDPGTWHAYDSMRGAVYGLGALEGLRYDLHGAGNALQVGVGADGVDLEYGALCVIDGELATQPYRGAERSQTLEGSLALGLGRSVRESVQAASFGPSFDGERPATALRIDGLGDDFVFVSGGELTQGACGAAQLSGIVARQSFPAQRFFFEAELGQRRDPGAAGYPPVGSPRLSLPAEFLREHGGVVAPGSWTYFEHIAGTLHGLDDFAGARVRFEREGPAFQVGLGASDRGADFGAAGWLAFAIEERPRHDRYFPAELGSGALTLEPRRGIVRRAEGARALAAVDLPAGHAFRVPGLATDLVFPDGGEFRENEDGSATLTGAVVCASTPEQSFDVLLEFTGRVEPGMDLPPGREPVLELPSSAYVERGGPVDPDSWRYFEGVQGILVGTGAWAGSLLEVHELGGAVQVGYGANGRNLEHGVSARLEVAILRAPVEADWPEGHVQGRMDLELSTLPR